MRFKNIFDNQYTSSQQQQNLLKELETDNGLLYKLIQLDENENAQSMLVRDLIEVLFEKIEIKREDLIRNAFHEPTKSTCTYRILFTDLLKRSPLYIKTIEQLIPIWEEWERYGFCSTEIKIWAQLNDEQQRVACQIWNAIGGKTRGTIRFEELIDKTMERRKMIIRIIDNIKLCTENYCQEASDRSVYDDLLKSIKTQLEEEKVLSIAIPEKIEEIKPLAERLNTVFSSRVWQNYYHGNIKLESTFVSLLFLFRVENQWH